MPSDSLLAPCALFCFADPVIYFSLWTLQFRCLFVQPGVHRGPWTGKAIVFIMRVVCGDFLLRRTWPNSPIARRARYFISPRRIYPSRQEIGRQWTLLVTYCSVGCKILRIRFLDGIDSVSLKIRANQRCRLVRCQLNGALLSLSGNTRYGAVGTCCLVCRTSLRWYLYSTPPAAKVIIWSSCRIRVFD